MPEEHRGAAFECQNPNCSNRIEVTLNNPDFPGWGICACNYTYSVDRDLSNVRGFDDSGNREIYDREDIPMEIDVTISATRNLSDQFGGTMSREEMRNELLADLSEKGAVTMERIPVPLGAIEDLGTGSLEALLIKIYLEGAPPALRKLSEYYAEEVEKVVEKFGNR